MKTKFCKLHLRGRSTPHKIGEFYLSEHARRPQFAQNSILARSKGKIRRKKQPSIGSIGAFPILSVTMSFLIFQKRNRKTFYSLIVSRKAQLPSNAKKLRQNFNLTEEELKLAFALPHK